MFLEEKIVSILAFAFFIACIISISHLSFFFSNSDVKKRIYTIPLMYGIFIAAFETFNYRNTPNLEILPSRAIGGTLELIAGFYFGYQFCILVKITDDTSFMESSYIAIGFCCGFGEAGRQLGNFLSNILLPI